MANVSTHTWKLIMSRDMFAAELARNLERLADAKLELEAVSTQNNLLLSPISILISALLLLVTSALILVSLDSGSSLIAVVGLISIVLNSVALYHFVTAPKRHQVQLLEQQIAWHSRRVNLLQSSITKKGN